MTAAPRSGDGQVAAQCLLPSADTTAPLKQGDLGSLCGLYAAINAVRLVLASKGSLDAQLWHDMLRSLLVKAHCITGLRITMSQPLLDREPPSSAEAFALLESAIQHRRPVLTEMAGWFDHYTVVSGYTPYLFRLFDSGKLQRLIRNACGVDGGQGRVRHVIRPRSLTVLGLDVR